MLVFFCCCCFLVQSSEFKQFFLYNAPSVTCTIRSHKNRLIVLEMLHAYDALEKEEKCALHANAVTQNWFFQAFFFYPSEDNKRLLWWQYSWCCLIVCKHVYSQKKILNQDTIKCGCLTNKYWIKCAFIWQIMTIKSWKKNRRQRVKMAKSKRKCEDKEELRKREKVSANVYLVWVFDFKQFPFFWFISKTGSIFSFKYKDKFQ